MKRLKKNKNGRAEIPMKVNTTLGRFSLAFVLIAAAILGSLTSIQEQYMVAFATIVPLEPLEPRPDSTEDTQEDKEEGKEEEKEEGIGRIEEGIEEGIGRIEEGIDKEEKDKNNDDEEDSSDSEDFVPVVISGNNVYLAWWTNITGNDEVMFRASTDGGNTFGDKINLSNTINANSTRVEIDGEGDNVIVSWWETNKTLDTPVARVSNDNGATFGPMLMLSTNGTLGEVAP